MDEPAVIMKGITKSFPGIFRSVVANNNIDLSLQKGEIHVIVGENGAGKTTLMNILYGMLQPDKGHIEVFGNAVKIPDPQRAIDLGIIMIHQHFMLIPSLTIGENIVLGREPNSGILLNRKQIRDIVLKLSTDLGMQVEPDQRVSDATVGVQQRVEILKAIYRGAKILILDEPTAVLTPQEIDDFLRLLKKLSEEGTTIILITHKLPEVKVVADRVTVLRDGKVVGQVDRANIDERQLAEMMTGRPYQPRDFNQSHLPQETILSLNHVSCLNDRGLNALNNVSFSLNTGEILGISGVAHNGQDELAEILIGERSVVSGSIKLDHREITNFSVRKIRELGIGYIPQDRFGEGCAREAIISRNMIMGVHRSSRLSGSVLLKQSQINLWSDELIKNYAIKTSHRDMPISSLSGGNVQKTIVAREMKMTTRCLIAEQPSRGIDIGAAEFIYERFQDLKASGAGIILISTDLNEIMRLSDRILVLYKGSIVGERTSAHTSPKELGLLMAGIGWEL